jgi:predicted RNase H-like HicB family nuclease
MGILLIPTEMGEMIFSVTIESGPPNWSAGCADEMLGGVVTATASSRANVIREFKAALRFHIESLKLSGIDVPRIDKLEIRELIPAERLTTF